MSFSIINLSILSSLRRHRCFKIQKTNPMSLHPHIIGSLLFNIIKQIWVICMKQYCFLISSEPCPSIYKTYKCPKCGTKLHPHIIGPLLFNFLREFMKNSLIMLHPHIIGNSLFNARLIPFELIVKYRYILISSEPRSPITVINIIEVKYMELLPHIIGDSLSEADS